MSESNNNTPMRITQLEEATSYPEGAYLPIAKAGYGTKKIDAFCINPTVVDTINTIQEKQFDSGIEKLISGYDANNATLTNPWAAPFVLPKEYYNEEKALIFSIKINVSTIGTLSVGYISGDVADGGDYDSNDITITNILKIESTGEQTILLPKPFYVPEGNNIVVCMPTDTAKFKYGDNGTKRFLYVSSSKFAMSYNSLGLDIFGMKLQDFSTILEDVKSTLPILSDVILEDGVLFDGYNASNSSASSFNTSPYVIRYNNFGVCYLKSLKLIINGLGKLTIGAIKKVKAEEGLSYNLSDIRILKEINFYQTGEQTYTFDNPLKLNEDEYLTICLPTDTASFKYGAYGTDKKFLFVSNGKFTETSSSIGIKAEVIAVKENSIYNGKKLSILGDSISTFSGYIPEGNVTYYPQGTVQSVSDTWWYKLYTALGMTLDVNNSWSGSRVTTTAGDDSAGCMTRCENLGNPDVIIVYMGINDFNNEVALGTYDGTSALPNDTTKFREAYSIMLNKILTKYQSAEVWVATLPQCERNGETGFPEVNGNGVALVEFNKAIKELAEAFGVKVLDHNKCGLTYQNMPTFNPDNLHPNKYGHSLFANNDIRQMDNAVRKRYVIS
jgi:lysophospholipase L1-like esterase